VPPSLELWCYFTQNFWLYWEFLTSLTISAGVAFSRAMVWLYSEFLTLLRISDCTDNFCRCRLLSSLGLTLLRLRLAINSGVCRDSFVHYFTQLIYALFHITHSHTSQSHLHVCEIADVASCDSDIAPCDSYVRHYFLWLIYIVHISHLHMSNMTLYICLIWHVTHLDSSHKSFICVYMVISDIYIARENVTHLHMSH